jgi:multidrug resistance efflux pump
MDIIRTDRKKKRAPYYIGGGVLALALITAALSQLEPAAPGVERAAIYTDTVRRGTFMRQVRGPGTLVPERIVIISARTNGRIEELFVQPGVAVEPGTLLMRLSNPDVQLQLLESERLLTQARSGLIQLQATLQSQTLALEAALATAQSAYNEAGRQAKESEELASKGLIARNEASRRADALAEAEQRLAAARKQLEVSRGSVDAQVDGQRLQVERLEGIVRYRQGEVESLNVRASASGVLQRLGSQTTLEVGQWVFSGTELARVVQPGRLKAQVRIPETQIRDVVVGQVAWIDTRNDTIRGRVVRIDPAAVNGTVGVDVTLEGELPASARPDLSIDGTIELDRVENALYVGRPGYGAAGQTVGLFRLTSDGRHAERVSVRLGRTSVNHVEILGGLEVGDIIILSDMSTMDQHERVRLQ